MKTPTGYSESQSIQNAISTELFGEFKVDELIDKEVHSSADTRVTTYYTKESYDEVVAHFDGALGNSEGYDFQRYPGDTLAILKGTINDAFVMLTIEAHDEGRTFVAYTYEGPLTGETIDQAELELIEADFLTRVEAQIDATVGSRGVVIREEIGQLDWNEWEEEWDEVYYPKHLSVMVQGVTRHVAPEVYYAVGNKSIPEKVVLTEQSWEAYFRNSDAHVVSHYDGETSRDFVSIYSSKTNETLIVSEGGQRIKEKGNALPIRLLEIDFFRNVETLSERFPVSRDSKRPSVKRTYIEKQDGARFLVVSYYTPDTEGTYNATSFTYDFDNRLIIAYLNFGTEYIYGTRYPEGKIVEYHESWEVVALNDTSEISETLFDFNAY